jgi:hypothetical protein
VGHDWPAEVGALLYSTSGWWYWTGDGRLGQGVAVRSRLLQRKPRSRCAATILSATYTSWGFSAMVSILHSRIANCE